MSSFTNLSPDPVVNTICNLLDDLLSFEKGHHNKLIQFVKDRPGHDQRYALNNKKVLSLGWKPQYLIEDALAETYKTTLDEEVARRIQRLKDEAAGQKDDATIVKEQNEKTKEIEEAKKLG